MHLKVCFLILVLLGFFAPIEARAPFLKRWGSFCRSESDCGCDQVCENNVCGSNPAHFYCNTHKDCYCNKACLNNMCFTA
ncbi:unnamed protein product [Caenorhabditis auriculariae]|uniref:Uncharacterized protein n=1 Tax=Caenorhabditis auriculariae TaxID=2777116 RepID=A0A8S1GQN3_9PELO|nr:unnamed protein product [Caenorhabditis auriculariae]